MLFIIYPFWGQLIGHIDFYSQCENKKRNYKVLIPEKVFVIASVTDITHGK